VIGDFNLAFWHPNSRSVTIARDVFGVRTVYYRQFGDCIAIASQSAPLSDPDRYDLEFVSQFLLIGYGPLDRSPFAGVSAVRPGHTMSIGDGRITSSPYWTTDQFAPQSLTSVSEAVDRFRELFQRAVTVRLRGRSDCWARLSGGLDSSSIVCTAQSLASVGRIPHGIGGTITTVDSYGRGDERDFSDEVIGRYRLCGLYVVDYWMWRDDHVQPPLTDVPTTRYPFFARDLRSAELVRNAGGRSLLCGIGADHYLSSTGRYISDLFGQGHVDRGLREAYRWAVNRRRSLWKILRNYALPPLLPPAMRSARLSRKYTAPRWIAPTMLDSVPAETYVPYLAVERSRRGEWFQEEIRWQMRAIPPLLQRELSAAGLEVSYPFLYRPLVEFALTLPPEVRVRPYQMKWILRAAVGDVLPTKILERTGKGSIGAGMLWSLKRESHRLEAMLKNPILADLGCVEPKQLRAALADALSGGARRVGRLLNTLALETWLYVRAGRWNENAVS
jgi:asparagine synthase (glutamine-hydrolysing)